MSVIEMSMKVKVSELAISTTEFYHAICEIYEKINHKERPDLAPLLSTSASIMTYASYIFKRYEVVLGIAGAGLTLFNLEDDNDRLREAIFNKDTEMTIISALTVVADVANIIAAVPIPQIKGIAIGVSASANLIKESYKNKEKIAKNLRGLGRKLASFAYRLRTDPSIYLDHLQNSAIRCHVVNGLNQPNKYFSQKKRLEPNILQPSSKNWERAAALNHLNVKANDLHQKFKQMQPAGITKYSLKMNNFEWRAPTPI